VGLAQGPNKLINPEKLAVTEKNLGSEASLKAQARAKELAGTIKNTTPEL
jgi:hypothetical protein